MGYSIRLGRETWNALTLTYEKIKFFDAGEEENWILGEEMWLKEIYK